MRTAGRIKGTKRLSLIAKEKPRPSCAWAGRNVESVNQLFGAAGFGSSADRFVFRLQHDAVKRSSGHEAATKDADPAQRVSAVGTALPRPSTVAALEDHPSRVAGSEQALVGGIKADGSDVLVRQTVDDMLPGGAAVSATEGAFTGSDHNLTPGSNSHATDANQVRWQSGRLPGHALIT